jgi:hypothetical protein
MVACGVRVGRGAPDSGASVGGTLSYVPDLGRGAGGASARFGRLCRRRPCWKCGAPAAGLRLLAPFKLPTRSLPRSGAIQVHHDLAYSGIKFNFKRCTQASCLA